VPLVLSGGRHFCAGGDLSALAKAPLEMRRAMQIDHRIVRALTTGPLPVVAAVQGTAYGAGFSIAMACDFVVADEKCDFCAAFGRVGYNLGDEAPPGYRRPACPLNSPRLDGNTKSKGSVFAELSLVPRHWVAYRTLCAAVILR
jgi:hypothetical protein